MEIARHGTVYTVSFPQKFHDLTQFTIHIDLERLSDGLNAFEKIFSYFNNEEEMNFLLGQWKDGQIVHLRTDKQINGINFGLDESEKRTANTSRERGSNAFILT